MDHTPGAPPLWSRITPELHAQITTRGVMLGIPCYGGHMVEATSRSLEGAMRRLDQLGIPCEQVFIRNESHVERARNTIAAHFLASNCDQLVFVDSDIGFAPDHLVRLLAHAEPLVGGIYRKKTLAVEWAFAPLVQPNGTTRRRETSGLIEARHVATGFLKVRREVFERIVEASPELRYLPHPTEGASGAWREHLATFFSGGICAETRMWLSEDYGFCERWRRLGGEVWADPTIILQHFGQVGLWADPADMFQGA